MKKIIILLIGLVVCSISAYSQPVEKLKYDLVLNGTTLEVWGHPYNAAAGTKAAVGSGNQCTVKIPFDASVSVSANHTGTWQEGTTGITPPPEVKYTIITMISSFITIDPFETGTPVHLFDIDVACVSDGPIAILNSSPCAIIDPVPTSPPGQNWGNNFNVIINGQGGDIYDCNEPDNGITCTGGAPLPVELLSFTGRNTPDGNQLNWKTASELNNAGFDVQKSADAVNWENIGWVEGRGTTELTNDYDLLDREPFVGDNYYRLKQIDYDGAFEYSNIINIENRVSDVFIHVSPNPSPGEVKITVVNPNKEKMYITLFDSAGQLIWKSEVIRDMDLWKKQFNLTQKEMYFINVIIGDKTYSEKILIVDRA